MIKFEERTHSYTNVNDSDKTEWTSVTSFTSKFKNKFDAESQAVKSSQNKKSKWYGLTPEEIKLIWEAEGKRSTDLGTWYHNQREQDLLSHHTFVKRGFQCSIKKPMFDGNYKIAPEQKLENNSIYPEHFVYLKSAGLCGQSDIVEVINNKLYISDFKTNKTLEKTSFVDWEGKHKMMLKPIHHLQDCHLNHYSLQLSFYAYIILKHNPQLQFGGLTIHHIKFEEESLDKYGYPIYKKDIDSNFIVKSIEDIELPYLKQECVNLINYKLKTK